MLLVVINASGQLRMFAKLIPWVAVSKRGEGGRSTEAGLLMMELTG